MAMAYTPTLFLYFFPWLYHILFLQHYQSKYINTKSKPYIRPNEFKFLKGKDYFVQQKLETYISDYKKALLKPHEKRNKLLCKFSTLQYFHNELGIK